jgi:hypothetical protein
MEDRAMSPDKLCFVIGPYGASDSRERKWSNFLFDKVIRPVAETDYAVERTIDNPALGSINDQIKSWLRNAPLVIADLTYANPNVCYELGMRHALDRPFIHINLKGTRLPFDLAGFQTIEVKAKYEEEEGVFWASDPSLDEARNNLRAQLSKVNSWNGTKSSEPYSAKVYSWETWYSVTIAKDWLQKQPPEVRQFIQLYEEGSSGPIPDDLPQAMAEYLELKSAANQRYKGKLFYTVNNFTKQIEFGYAMYDFPNSPPILIEIGGRYLSDDSQEISFVQPGRSVSVGALKVDLPGYKYQVTFSRDPRNNTWMGTLAHPETNTRIGNAELDPKYFL